MGLLLEVSASRLLRLFMKCTPRYLHRNKRVVSALSHLRRPGGILRLSALSLSLSSSTTPKPKQHGEHQRLPKRVHLV
jgi:hypothetical protein